jgi:tetratricopeptide (TPR) repeat protein
MKLVSGLVAMIMLAASTSVQAANYCGSIGNAYGPFDYRDPAAMDMLAAVEGGHFTPNVEKLISGITGSLGQELDYTLRAFPNHQRALASLARLGLRNKATHINGTKWSVECYFNRAVRFKPDDDGVRVLYGSYLFRLGRIDEAIEQLNEAVGLAPENATANYNLGLLYLEKKDYAKALAFAKKAETLGFPLPGLKNKLVEMGKWDAVAGK